MGAEPMALDLTPIRMTISVPGDGDLLVVNAHRRLRGRPESTLQWSCQHSCSPGSIPTCTDANCEASCRLSDDDIAEIRDLVERADLAPFDDVRVDYTVSGPAEQVEAMSRHVPQARASVLALARFAAGGDVLDPMRAATADALRSSLYYAARALLDQRVVDRRTTPGSKACVCFTTNGDFPKTAYLALGCSTRIDDYDTVVGLDDDATNFGYIKAGASRVPGDVYGPRRRMIVRIDERVFLDLQDRVAAHVAGAAGRDAGDACLECFVDVASRVGLPPVPDADPDGDPFLRASRYVARLMRAISF